MKKAFLWIGVVLVALIAVGAIIEATESPEEKAARAAEAKEIMAAREVAERKRRDREALEKLVGPASDVLTLAYINRVKDQRASFVRCSQREFESRFFYRCGISYGGTALANNGLWEAAADNGRLVLYAMNGKALAALDKIGESNEFQRGHSRPRIDTGHVYALFDQ